MCMCVLCLCVCCVCVYICVGVSTQTLPPSFPLSFSFLLSYFSRTHTAAASVCLDEFDRKKPSPRGGSYLQCSLIKNREQEDLPRSTWYKFFKRGPLTHGSLWGNIVNRKSSRGGRFLSIKFSRIYHLDEFIILTSNSHEFIILILLTNAARKTFCINMGVEPGNQEGPGC